MAKLIAFAGSARKDSYNKKLVLIAAEGARKAGAEVTFIDLRDYPMPLYDGDLEAEQGLPENARKLKAMFKAHDGFLIASPEYNSSFTPLLKNTIDWVSRVEGDEPMLAAYAGKTAALVSAAPGKLGGIRGLVPLRMLLSNINIHVIPEQHCLEGCMTAFNDDGTMKDATRQAMVEAIGAALAEATQKLKG